MTTGLSNLHESGTDNSLQNALKATECARRVELAHWPRILPETEAVRIVRRVTADHGDEGVKHAAQQEQQFAESEPELCRSCELML